MKAQTSTLKVSKRNGDIEAQKEAQKRTRTVLISPPKIESANFEIIGLAPLVIHRFSAKSKNMMLETMKAGNTAKNKKMREPLDVEETYNSARYISTEGWDGFNVASIRCALISACRLVGFPMTKAKLSIFTEADGRDALEPEFGLIRIYGESRILESIARVETGQAYVTIRPCYDEWSAKIRLRFDSQQFTLEHVSNLLARAGLQVGIGEGRPDSKNSAGMGWGIFRIKGYEEEEKD